MRKPKVIILTVSVLSLFAGTLLFDLIIVHASNMAAPNTSIAKSNPTQNALYPRAKQTDTKTTKQKVVMTLAVAPQPTTKAPAPKPTAATHTSVAPVMLSTMP